MIRNLKTGLKILKYGHGVKSTVICTVIVVILGAASAIMDIINPVKGGASFLPIGYFVMLASLFLIQLFYSVNVAGIVQASPLKKKLQTSVPMALNVTAILCGYLATVLTEGIALVITPEAEGHICRQLVFTILLLVVIMVYTAAAYKLFFLTTVMFFMTFFTCYQFMYGSLLKGIPDGGRGTFWLLAAAGLGIILICSVLYYLITLALYKLPLSKMAQAGALRRQM